VEITRELNMPLSIDQSFDRVNQLGLELGWHLARTDGESHMLQWNKGNYWWSHRLRLRIELQSVDDFTTRARLKMWDPMGPANVLGQSEILKIEFEHLLNRLQRSEDTTLAEQV
jgi:hypothetical protein